MSYTVAYKPPSEVWCVSPKSVISKPTATDAWTLVQQISGNDKNTEVKDPSGQTISLRELRDRAS
jgi:hypothetical protein